MWQVPISAIESKPTHLLTTNHVNLSKSNKNKLASSDTTDSAQTPVLVTITMANKHHLSTALDNSSSKAALSSTKCAHRSRRRSASYAPRKSGRKDAYLSKEESVRAQKSSCSVKSGVAAENCGTVELLKLTKSMSNFFTDPDSVKNSIASECITGGCVSSIAINTVSDNENNISSSSSSQQLLEICETNSHNKSKVRIFGSWFRMPYFEAYSQHFLTTFHIVCRADLPNT